MYNVVLAVLLFVAVWLVAGCFVRRFARNTDLEARNSSVWKRYGNAGRSLADLQKSFATREYPIFTTDYDVEVRASDLWMELGVSKEARQVPSQEDFEFLGELSKALIALAKAETLVTILIDHSGSMRGEQARAVASAVVALGTELDKAQTDFEILGFTTRSWHGGQARKKWISEGRLKMPGRLCELLHIVYKSYDQRFAEVKHDLNLLNNDGLLRENIDGEAILWANSRFQASGLKRWVCIVICDGAPVDDSTLSSNKINVSCSLLEDHLIKTVSAISAQPSCVIAGLGVKYDVPRFYSVSESAEGNEAILRKLALIILRAVEASNFKT
jgi:cobalamin biosynthesis protein CobT